MSKLNLVIEKQTHLDDFKENNPIIINENSNCHEEEEAESEEIIKNINLLYSYKIIDCMKFSPININVCNAKILKLSPLKWINYEKLPKKIKLTNTGETLILSAKWTCERPYICGGPLLVSSSEDNSKYVFSQIHFHWGKTALEGSEHTIDNGYRMPLEMHVIHFKKSYLNQTEALKYDDGVICLVYMFQIRSNHNPIIHEIVSKLNKIQIADTTIEIPPFQLTKLIFTFDSDYYLYWGCAIKSSSSSSSMAGKDNHRTNQTPQINDSKHLLLWFISREITNLSYEQLGLFRQLLNFKLCPIIRNWRCIQGEEEKKENKQILKLHNSQIFHINPMYEHTNSTLSPISKRFEIDSRIHNQSSGHNRNANIRNSLKNDYIVRTLMDQIRI